MNARVSFESDGLRLAGALHVPGGDAPRPRRPGFLVLHGFGSNKDSGGSVATATMLAEGHKGSGLSLMIERLTSLVASNPIIADALKTGGGRHTQNGLVLAIDVARFADPAVFRTEVERLIAAVKALPREPGVGEILVPGERGDRTFERRIRDGIPISRATCDELARVADRFRVTMP
ncbi:MAG TPA: Ldh family oxidoreductase [Gemmatimonadaceae bacterium]|nr:Ldh family oxidoreductase [Gemmatimonadaceae bacterium]